MKLQIKKNQINVNHTLFLKRLGYGTIRDRHNGLESFVRRLGKDFYPRFHIYVKDEDDLAEINIHIDHKKIGIASGAKHNAEYNSELVVNELNRIKNELNNSIKTTTEATTQAQDKKKSFWQKILMKK